MVGHDAQDQPQRRAAQERQSDHEAALGVVEFESRRDRVRQRPQQHPHHEADVEVQEGAQQGRRVAGFEKAPQIHSGSSAIQEYISTASFSPSSANSDTSFSGSSAFSPRGCGSATFSRLTAQNFNSGCLATRPIALIVR
jgi:hypothetical protein